MDLSSQQGFYHTLTKVYPVGAHRGYPCWDKVTRVGLLKFYYREMSMALCVLHVLRMRCGAVDKFVPGTW